MIYVATNINSPVYHSDKDCSRIKDADLREYPDDHRITEWKDECKRCQGWEPDEDTKRKYGNGLARKIRQQHNEEGETA